MTTIQLIKAPDCSLRPSLDRDAEIIAKWKSGDVIQGEFKRPRNGKRHRWFFALLQVVHQNQDRYEEFEAFRREFVLRCGWFEWHTTLKGTQIPVAKSISYENCDEDSFGEICGKAIDVAIKYFMVGTDPDELNRKVDQILSFM